MTFFKTSALALAASTFAMQPAVAQAEQACVTEEAVSAMIVYGLPHVMRAAGNKCAGTLSADGFFALQAEAMANRYMAHSDEAWPLAYDTFLRLAEANGASTDDDFPLDELSDDAVRPLITEMLAIKFTEDMKLEDCRKIERAAEALAPLEPWELGNLSAVILSIVGVDNPSICPVE